MPSTTTVLVLLLSTAVVGAFDSARLRDLPVETCHNGGELKDGKCECTMNYRGVTCEEQVCLNGGRPSHKNGVVHCACPWGLKGARCEMATKCDNDGVLNEKGVCECRKGFVGIFCSARPCHNGQPILIPGEGEYSCACDIGFTGAFCEQELICNNGGRVSTEVNECVCYNGFIGVNCEVCEHVVENGRCVPEISEMAMAGAVEAPFLEWHLIAVIGGTLFVLLLLIIAVIFAVRSYRTKPSRVSSAQGSAIVPNPEGTDV